MFKRNYFLLACCANCGDEIKHHGLPKTSISWCGLCAVELSICPWCGGKIKKAASGFGYWCIAEDDNFAIEEDGTIL